MFNQRVPEYKSRAIGEVFEMAEDERSRVGGER